MTKNFAKVRLLACVLVLLGATLAMGAYFPAPQQGQSAAPAATDNALFTAYKLLEKQPAYKIRMDITSSDPRMAQMAASGMGLGKMETLVKGDTRQATLKTRMPATDVPGQIDDWTVRAVVRNGKAARIMESPAVPRILAASEQKTAMEMAMLDMQASRALATAAFTGPMGALNAAMTAGDVAMGHLLAAQTLKKERQFFEWKCSDAPAQNHDEKKSAANISELRAAGEESINGVAATKYEFYVNENGKRQGPVNLYVGKDSGLPMRMEMSSPEMRGSLRMEYEVLPDATIEIPPCMASAN